MTRPAVDVVVPFRGSEDHLERLVADLAALERREGDTVTVVDNTPGQARRPLTGAPVSVMRAAELQTPGYARNRGVTGGSAPWVAFLDADVAAPASLLDRLFDPAPRDDTAILAGAIRDSEPAADRRGAAPRYSHLRSSMSQEMTLQHGEWGFVQTANCACRRSAFEGVGGFRAEIRAGEDADLCYRLRAAGWGLERRDAAAAVHTSRRTVRALLAQKACHGAAAAWLDRAYPGAFPARRVPGLTWWGVRRAATGVAQAVRERDRDEALMAVLDPATTLAYELGRSLPNERPLRLRRR